MFINCNIVIILSAKLNFFYSLLIKVSFIINDENVYNGVLLLISQIFIVPSYDPLTNINEFVVDHDTLVTQFLCDDNASFTTAISINVEETKRVIVTIS